MNAPFFVSGKLFYFLSSGLPSYPQLLQEPYGWAGNKAPAAHFQ